METHPTPSRPADLKPLPTPSPSPPVASSLAAERPPPQASTPPIAPVLMVGFWALLGSAAGINLTQSLWRIIGFEVGDVAVAVPVGGTAGAVAGGLLGLVTHPRALVLLMAVFAGSAAGGVAGRVPWGNLGEIGGQIAGGLVGGFAWATWLYLDRRKKNNRDDPNFQATPR